LIRIYLAGPEVFLANAKEIGERKKDLCKKYGIEGIFPLDTESDTTGKKPKEIGLYISQINEKLISNCNAVIANITPFRGPSVDVGTAYEMGFAHGLGKKVFAYSNSALPFAERTTKALNGQLRRGTDGRLRDKEGMFIEEMDMIDNLMIDGCVDATSKCLIVEQAPLGERFTYLGAFEKCLKVAKNLIIS
jgi:nucleoside 2-deoxyribosyltransferase